MKITKREIRKIIREEKARILNESTLDDPGGAAVPPGELISKLEKIMSLVSKVDEYLNIAAGTARDDTAMNVDMAFEANGDVEYQLQQLVGMLKGL